MKLSKYPKRGISLSQFSDEEKIRKQEKKDGVETVCSCGGKKFMMTPLGLRVCCKCYRAVGFVL